jgi:hypothetical protein
MKIRGSMKRFLAAGLIVGFALCAVIDKAVSEIIDYLEAEKPHVIAKLEEKLAGIGERIAPNESVGFLSDDKREDVNILTVQYAITPVLLEEANGQPLIIGCFVDPMTEEDFLQKFGLTLVEDLGDGIYLLKREAE